MSDTNKINDGGPAFPGNGEQFVEGVHGIQPQSAYGMHGSEGMTLRDYFAAKAMQAMVSNGASLGSDQRTAEVSYRIADAMIAAREPK